MGKRKFCSFVKLAVVMLTINLIVSGCENPGKESDIAGKTYVYEKEGFGGDFTIRIDEDGTFSYYEGPFSSYFGTGEWTLDGNILCLSEDAEAGKGEAYYFKADGNSLIFLAEKSGDFMFIQVSDGERFTERKEEENLAEEESEEEGKERSDVMTVREYARLLEEAGITELTEEKIAQVEAMIENMPEEIVEALDPAQVPAFLLTAVGAGEYDFDSLTWTPDSRQVYSFDLEVFDAGQMYTQFLEGIMAINEGEFELTQIKEEVKGEERPEGPESHKIQFCYNGTEYMYEAEVYYDWFDTGMIAYMNHVLEKEGNPKRLYSMGDGYQECIVLYCTEEWADEFNRKTGCGIEVYL